MAFGWSSKGKPTPAHIVRRCDMIAGIAVAVSAFVTGAPFIPQHLSEILVYCINGIGGLALVVKPYFSVDDVPRRVPAEDVTAMETKDA